MFRSMFDIDKDGFLTVSELATIVFHQQLNGPIEEQN